MIPDFVNIATISTFLAGIIATLTTIYFRDWLSRKQKEVERRQRQLAVYSGIYPIRNFIIEKLNTYEEDQNKVYSLTELKFAVPQIENILGKANADEQGLMLAVIDLGLRTTDLYNYVESNREASSATLAKEVEGRVDALTSAIDMYDIQSSGVLGFVNIEDFIDLESISNDLVENKNENEKINKTP